MTSEFGKDELLAQAILDLELKMKHEIRQNNAFLLSKIEKHYEQMDKKLTFLEVKMDTMGREREDRQQTHSSRGGRRTNYYGANNFTPNVQMSGRAAHMFVDGGNRRPSGAVPPPNIPNQQQQHPYKVFGGMGGVNGSAASNRQHQFKPSNNTDKPMGEGGHGHGGRYKQTLGTSKAQVASPSSTIQQQWTTKAAGLYSDDEDSSDSESQKSEANTPNLPMSTVALDPPISTVALDPPISTAAPDPPVVTLTLDPPMSIVTPGATITPVVGGLSTVTPGATVTPVVGGFGRRHK